jgi:hypothetical protein
MLKRYERMVNTSLAGISGVLALVAVFIVFTFPQTGCGCAPTTSEPHVQLTPAEPEDETTWRTEIMGVSKVEDLERFKAVLVRNGVQIDVLDSLEGSSDSINFMDLDSRGTLTTGDMFTITCGPDSAYGLHILWKDSGNVRASVEWTTGPYGTDPLD